MGNKLDLVCVDKGWNTVFTRTESMGLMSVMPWKSKQQDVVTD